MNMKMPAIILVRGGSQRLKRKWALPWPPRHKTSLLDSCIRAVLRCKYVSLVWVGTDDHEIIRAVGERFGHDTREHWAREHRFNRKSMVRVDCVKRKRVSPNQSSLEALAYVRRVARIEASYCMLVQCTYPFIDPADLDRLVEAWRGRGSCDGMFLGRPDQPNRPAGCAWIVHPFTGYQNVGIPVTAPCIDIDVRAHYDEACAEWEKRHE
jgi:CMP-N-acetylneuraminic acid synthetase